MSADTDTPSFPEVKIPEGKLRIWLAELRAPFLTGSIIPVAVGASIAWGLYGVFYWDLFLLTLIVGVFIHLGANVSNDYFDHKSSADDINVEFIRPFTGGARMIQLGLLTPSEVLVGSLVFFAIAGAIGVYLALTRGLILLVIGVIGAGSAFFYTAPPLRFVHRGIGEIFIGLDFGVLLVLAAYFVQVQLFDIESLISSLPIAILISAILYINEFPDAKADEAAGKRTVVVRLGKSRAALGYIALMSSVYFVILIGILLDWIRWTTILVFATLPLSIYAMRHTLRKYDRGFELAPANASTVMIHLFTGVFLILAYVLYGLSAHPFVVAIMSLTCLAIVLVAYRKVSAPPPQPDINGSSPDK